MKKAPTPRACKSCGIPNEVNRGERVEDQLLALDGAKQCKFSDALFPPPPVCKFHSEIFLRWCGLDSCATVHECNVNFGKFLFDQISEFGSGAPKTTEFPKFPTTKQKKNLLLVTNKRA